MNGKRGKLRVDRFTVRDLVSRLDGGRLLIPEFQRDYVWKPSRAAKLIDSMFHRLPVGALLIWDTADEVGTRVRRADRRGGTTSWLIDGQQRSRTLQRVMASDQDDRFEVLFHVTERAFARPNAATRRDPLWVPLSDLWGDGWRDIRNRLREDFPRHGTRIEENIDDCREILEYEVPVIYMEDHPFEQAVEAFERLNSLGVRLKRADLESAQVAKRHAGFIRDELVPLLCDLRRQGFGRVNVGHLFRATEVLARPNARRVRLHQLERHELAKAWKAMRQGLERTFQLLRSELSVSTMDLLWSGALLVPPIVISALARPRERNDGALAAWIVAAAVFHRYTGSTETAIEQDLRACMGDDVLKGLLKNLRASAQRRRLQVTVDDLDSSIQDRGALFAAYVACTHRGAVDLFTGQKITTASQANAIHRHHIFPRGGFPLAARSDADLVPNIAFILPEVNMALGKEAAGKYLPNIPGARRKSQCIPEDPTLYESYDDFYWRRAELLALSLNDFLKERGIE